MRVEDPALLVAFTTILDRHGLARVQAPVDHPRVTVGALKVQRLMTLVNGKTFQQRVIRQRDELIVFLEVGMALQADLVVHLCPDQVEGAGEVGGETLGPLDLGDDLTPKAGVRVAFHALDAVVGGMLPGDVRSAHLMACAARRGLGRVIGTGGPNGHEDDYNNADADHQRFFHRFPRFLRPPRARLLLLVALVPIDLRPDPVEGDLQLGRVLVFVVVARSAAIGLLLLPACGDRQLRLDDTEGVAVQVARGGRLDDARHVTAYAAAEIVDTVRLGRGFLDLLVATRAKHITR